MTKRWWGKGVSATVAGVFLATGLALAAEWPQWRGPNRDGLSPEVPLELPPKRLLWMQPLAGETHAGVAVAGGYVVVADHSKGADHFRCFRSESGAVVWSHTFPNRAEMDFGAAPRATPLLYQGTAITLSALGDVRCFELESGKALWKRHLSKDYKVKVPTWGYCGSPLVADGVLVLNPGAPSASLIGLDPKSGAEIWRAPGSPAAYGSFLHATLGGVSQVAGCDEGSLGGWDPKTGRRLWRVEPDNPHDYMVCTPILVDGMLLFSTDANYTRLYAFQPGGQIVPTPVAVSEDLGHDTAMPVALDGLVFGTAYGLVCLDVAEKLRLRWRCESEEALTTFATYIAGNGRVLVFTESGVVYLVAADRAACRILGSMSLCEKTWSHPALAGGRLFLRDAKRLYCYDFR